MSTIRFSFEDLCAFFTKNPSRLMVGMISTDKEAPEDVHSPHIVIKENGVVKREYSNFSQINGDISLDVYGDTKPFSHYSPRSKRDPRQTFNTVVDIEKTLYPGASFQADSKACRARLHFNNGELYSTRHAVNAVFADAKTGQPNANPVSTIATHVGLDVQIPKEGYAVLHFENDTEDFVFKAGRDYQVEVVNRAPSIDFTHFRFFYNIVRPKPKQKLIPISAQGVGPNLKAGDWACLVAAFGNSDYDLPKSKKNS